MDERLNALLDKKFVTVEDLYEIEYNENVVSIENCGNSGKYIGYTWFAVHTLNEEYSVYLKQCE